MPTLGVFVIALAAYLVQPFAEARPAASRIVDRTFLCSTVVTHGRQRDLDILADPRTTSEFAGVTRTIPAHLVVGSGPDTPDSDLVAVRSRQIRGISEVFPAGVYASARRCAATRISVPLSPKGLAGPPVTWGRQLNCLVPGRVLVRVRAALGAPAAWRGAGSVYVGAGKNVVEAALAVRVESTKSRSPS